MLLTLHILPSLKPLLATPSRLILLFPLLNSLLHRRRPLPRPPPPPPPSNYNWTIVNEVGDGACLLRCIARKVFHYPGRHFTVRENILQHIAQRLHNPFNNSGFSFDDAISFGVGIEPVQILNAPPTSYTSIHHYLELMTNPHARAGYLKFVAAQLVNNINISVATSD